MPALPRRAFHGHAQDRVARQRRHHRRPGQRAVVGRGERHAHHGHVLHPAGAGPDVEPARRVRRSGLHRPAGVHRPRRLRHVAHRRRDRAEPVPRRVPRRPAGAVVALPIAPLIFRLRGGYFSIGTWVIAEVVRLIVVQHPGDRWRLRQDRALRRPAPDRHAHHRHLPGWRCSWPLGRSCWCTSCCARAPAWRSPRSATTTSRRRAPASTCSAPSCTSGSSRPTAAA